jgi:hypothetical protein
MLSAAVLALAACGAGVSDGTTAPFSGSASVNISDYPALANVGGVALATINGSPLALVRNSTTSVLALSRVCPHQGGAINTAAADYLHAPRRLFNLTGQWVGAADLEHAIVRDDVRSGRGRLRSGSLPSAACRRETAPMPTSHRGLSPG